MRIHHHSIVAAAILLVAPAMATSADCPSQPFCTDAAAFQARVTDFRTSVAGSYRVATATVRITNKTNHPLVLGYVQGSGVVIDDLGNRYGIDTRNANSVRAIGIIKASTFDPKFTLQPGEGSDARFQFTWYPGKSIIGTAFQMEATLREIDPVGAAGQAKLGRETVVQFRGLKDGLADATVPVPSLVAGVVADAPAAAVEAVPPTDPCAGQPRCYNAGPFTAEVTQVTTSQAGSQHLVRLGLRFHNTGSQPLVLAYTTNSGTMIDNNGNRYGIDWRVNNRVQGIGQAKSGSADPQFVLSPGQSRNATLEYSRYVGQTIIGNVFTPDFVIQQLEVLPSRQIRPVRDYSISYANLTAGTMMGSSDATSGTGLDQANEVVGTLNNAAEAGRQLTEGLKSLFKKKK